MSVSELLYEAAILMLVGMVVVFVFLTLLIFATKLLSKFAVGDTSNLKAPDSAPRTKLNAPEPVIAAISAAIYQYKQNKK
ncbi:OadG family protein [Psychrosphaera aestuarii]|uniref:OadG family protein n=1 Tax=Psychrosphaera aestuarii TaxID=1266052 RepID=UPI001B339234|nr:OadG family transporter subunit [Psychrosphaera aestuarii]